MRRWLTVAALGAVVTAVVWLWPRSAHTPVAAAVYAGSDACRSCHPDEYARWRESTHGRHMGRPSPETVVGDFTDDNVYEYNGTRSRMFRDGDRYRMEYTRDGRTETYDIAWALGVARHQVYLWEAPDGRLQTLPTYWNVEEKHWRDNTEGPVDGPGPTHITDKDHWQNYGRTWQLACMECHGSQTKKNYDQKTNTYSTTFDPVINCESCHGPAGQHVARWKALDGDTPDGLRPLPDLDLTASIEVCARCHARKRIYVEAREDTPFYDAFAPDVWTTGHFFPDGRSSSLNYRYVEYMQSRCFKSAAQRMDCGYCHPPHGLESARGATVTDANAICTGCHIRHKTRLTEHTHHKPESDGSRCVDCHMPKMDLDLRMTVRDHTIGSPLPELTRDFGVPNACNQCHADRPVEWAIDVVDEWYGERPSFQALRERVRGRAEVLSKAFAGHPPVGPLAAWLDDPSRTLIERASAGELLGEAAPDPTARDALRRHLEDPHPLVRYSVLRSLGRFNEPSTYLALRHALKDERRIVRVVAYESLFFLQPEIETEKDPVIERVRAEYHYRQDVIRGDDPRWLPNLALWYYSRRQPQRAEALLRRAIRLAPNGPRHRADLVQLLVDSGRAADAEPELLRLEALAPGAPITGVTRATYLMALGRHREAVVVLQGHDQSNELVQRALAAAYRGAGGRR